MTSELVDNDVHDPDRPGYRRRRALSTAGAFSLMLTISLSIGLGFLVVPGSAHFGVSAAQFLLWYSIYTLSSAAVFTLLGKAMTDRGPKIVVICSATLVVACLVGMAYAPTIMVFYLLSVPLGIGWAGCTSLAANTIVIGWHVHERRGTILGIVAAATGLGGFVWGFLFPPVIAALGWQGGLLTIALLVTVLAVLPGIFLISNPPRAEVAATDTGETPRRAKLLAGGIAAVVILLTVAAAIFGLEAAFANIMPAVFAADGIDLAAAGLLVSLYSVCGMLAKPILGYMHDRWGIHATLAFLSVAYIIGLPGMALLSGNGLTPYFFILPLAALALATPTIALPLVTVQSVGRARFPVIYGTVISGLWIGLAFGAPAWGLSFDLTGSYNVALALAGVAGLTGIALSLVAIRAGRRASAARDEAAGTTAAAPATV
ncbi:MFS transporter [Pseudonocardia lacus]|uniref:MFS transporter n=1 Tax=Pseudonocardia lacus TaxID=2835865 RepID=UPI001BDD9617|nr:MFS transporter [Pseudonocardia lacus]